MGGKKKANRKLHSAQQKSLSNELKQVYIPKKTYPILSCGWEKKSHRCFFFDMRSSEITFENYTVAIIRFYRRLLAVSLCLFSPLLIAALFSSSYSYLTRWSLNWKMIEAFSSRIEAFFKLENFNRHLVTKDSFRVIKWISIKIKINFLKQTRDIRKFDAKKREKDKF